jgi:CheY-like chemotaxis protein
MSELKRILLAEDSRNDVELTLAALGEHHLAHEVVVVKDGVEAIKNLGLFWAVLNEPPPGGVRKKE